MNLKYWKPLKPERKLVSVFVNLSLHHVLKALGNSNAYGIGFGCVTALIPRQSSQVLPIVVAIPAFTIGAIL